MRGLCVVALLAAAVLAGCGTGSRPAAKGDPWSSLPAGWSSLEPPPFARARAVSVWTGGELFYWGGDTDYGAERHTDGALYDPVARRWRTVPSGPLDGRSSPGAVWTGKEVFLWGGESGYGTYGWSDGALFEPESKTWRMVAQSPLMARTPAAVVWTGREVIVWGDMSRSVRQGQKEGAAYSPETDRWRELPPAPLGLNLADGTWTGKELIVFGALLDANNWSKTKHAQGMAYDPDADSWRIIEDYPLSPQASSVAWTGNELIAWDYDLSAGAYDPNRQSWRKIGRLPLRFSECYPESARVRAVILAWFCGQAAAFDVGTSSWRRMPKAPGEIFGRPVAAGSVVLFAGAAHETERGNALWAYRP